MCPCICADSRTQTTCNAAACGPPSLRHHVLASLFSQVSEAFGLPYAGAAMKEAAAKWPVLAGMGKCDGEMCQVRRGMLCWAELGDASRNHTCSELPMPVNYLPLTPRCALCLCACLPTCLPVDVLAAGLLLCQHFSGPSVNQDWCTR